MKAGEREANYSVCVYHSGLAEAFERFVGRVWPKNASTLTETSSVRPKPPSASEKNNSPIFLFLKDQEVIGHVATLPVQLYSQSRWHVAYWVVGFLVLPEYRKGLIGPLLIKKVNETLDCALTLHVEEAPLRIFRGLGWKYAGVIPQYVNLRDPYSFLKNIRIGLFSDTGQGGVDGPTFLSTILSQPFLRFVLALISSIVLKAFLFANALRKPAPGAGTVTEETGFDASYDLLWARVAHKFDALVVRDRSYLEARYGRRMKHYRLLTYRENRELLGYCIVKLKQFSNDSRMGCMRVGTIVDCLFDPADAQALQSLLAAAGRLCTEEKVAAIFCAASYAPLQKLLSVNGFIQIPGNLNFAYYDKINNLRSDLSLASWHLMRGDSDADQNF